MKAKYIVAIFIGLGLLLISISAALAEKQEIIRYDHLAFVSEHGDIYTTPQDLLYNGHIRLKNDYTSDFNDVHVTFVIQELGLRMRYSPFDLEEDEYWDNKYPFLLDSEMDIEPGVYNVRVTVSDAHGHRRVKYRELVIQ